MKPDHRINNKSDLSGIAKIMKLTTGVFLLILFSSINCISQNTNEEHSLLWEVSGGGAKEPSYLFGTIHLICPTDVSYPPLLTEKLLASKQLYLEIDMDDPDLTSVMSKNMGMKNNTKLPDLLPEPDYNHINQFFKDSVGLNLSLFDQAKPFFLSSILFNRVLGCQPESYELKLMGMAHKEGKEVKGLESIETQLAIFDSIPYQKQAEMLLSLIKDLPKAKKEFEQLINVYKSKDIEKLREISQDSEFDFQNHEEVLLNTRNRNWIPVISEQVNLQSTFFAMGAAHLGGNQGVIALLREAGYTVKPLY